MLRLEGAKDNGKATAKNGCSVECGVVVGLRAPGSFAGEGRGSEGRRGGVRGLHLLR